MYRRYLWYLLRHKWFVFLACCRLGIPWAGVVHDLSKFRPSEFAPYARYFYGGVGGKGARGDYLTHAALERVYHGDVRNHVSEAVFFRWARERVQADFDRAWLLHQKRNAHHYQWYILHEDSGAVKLLPIPERYRKEMLADWRGAGRAAGRPDTAAWYQRNREHILLEPGARAWVERALGLAED